MAFKNTNARFAVTVLTQEVRKHRTGAGLTPGRDEGCIVASAEWPSENTLPDGMAMQNKKIQHSKPKESAMLETYFFQEKMLDSFHN